MLSLLLVYGKYNESIISLLCPLWQWNVFPWIQMGNEMIVIMSYDYN